MLRHTITALIALLFLLPAAAQEVLPADTIVSDSVITDTLLADTLLTDSVSGITVQQRIERLLEADMFQTSQVGIMVYDLTADTLVFAHNERQTLRPASTMKLLTAITALDRLGSAYRYTTTLSARGSRAVRRVLRVSERDTTSTLTSGLGGTEDELPAAVFLGDVTVRGGMDPRFSADDMRAFAEALQKERIDTIFGQLREDRSFKDSDTLGEGWCWDDKNPVLTPLPWQRRDTFMEKLRQTLRQNGIVVLPTSAIPTDSLGRPLYVADGKAATRTLCTRNHTIGQILTRMMKESDNLYAESLLYQIAASVRRPATAKDAAGVMKQVIRKAGLDPSRYRIADGSGLSLYNYQSAELQVRLLRYAFRTPDIIGHLLPTLPVAGVDGTLKKRMTTGPGRGNVHAKTGTLTGISSLAGYLTAASGNTLCFSIIDQGIMHAANAKRFQDRVCEALCRYE